MNVSINLNDEVVSLIEHSVMDRIEDVVNEIVSEVVDDIIKDTVRKQLRSCALMYLQSPEMRKALQEKVNPSIDKILEVQCSHK